MLNRSACQPFLLKKTTALATVGFFWHDLPCQPEILILEALPIATLL
jgi:hypothetical protein